MVCIYIWKNNTNTFDVLVLGSFCGFLDLGLGIDGLQLYKNVT